MGLQTLVVSDEELKHLSNEDYVIHKAKLQKDTDPIAARGWLLTAQVMYPQNFRVQYEVYKIAKEEKSVAEAAACLRSLFLVFADEPTMVVEMDSLMKVLCDNAVSRSAHHQFPMKVFYSMPKDVQKAMILSAAEKTRDTMQYCSLMLLLISKFPENTAKHGLKLVDALLKAEKPGQDPLNPYRDKLVSELLPRLLQAEGLEVKSKVFHQLMRKAVEFYVAYITTPTKVSQNLLKTHNIIEDPWQELFSIVKMIGWNLGWELATDFDSASNRELIVQKIQKTVDAGQWRRDNQEDVREVLYTTLTVFLHSLLDYTKQIYPDFNHGDTTNAYPPPLTLIEGFVDTEDPLPSKPFLSPPLKRSRLSQDEDTSKPLITVSRLTSSKGTEINSAVASFNGIGGPSSGALSQALITAIKCWDLLHAYEELRTEFAVELEGLGIERWVMIFNMDFLIYGGRLLDAEAQLRHTLARAVQAAPTSHTPMTVLTLNLKLASVLYALNKFSASADVVFDIVQQLNVLPGQGGLTPNLMCSTPPARRHLHLLALTRPQVLQFVVTLLIHQLRHLILKEDRLDDFTMGHLIVLIQYEWPRFEYILDEVIDVVKKKGGLAYHFFGLYVTTIAILEKFSSLASNAGGGYHLDLIPLAHNPKQQRISTRGADRGSKQDFKTAMKRQMLRVHERVEDNLISFLTIQARYIAPVFM